MKVAIVGAGLIGRLTALELVKAEHSVTLLESHSFDHTQNTAAISAAMVSPLSESLHVPEEVVRLGFRSCKLWPQILNTLQSLDPEHQNVSYQTHGTIAVSFPGEQECLLAHFKRLQTAVPEHLEHIRMLYNDEVTDIEPELMRFETGVFLANEANICNAQFLESTARALRKYASIVDHWSLKGDATELQQQYDWVVDCRGAGAVGLATHAEDSAHSLTAIRGEVLRVKSAEVNLLRPLRIIRSRYTVYIAPKPDHLFVVGATDSDKQGSRSVTVRSSLDLLSALYAVHPGFADAEIVAAVAGQRAHYSHLVPSINQFENILSLNGLNRQGWLAGPAMVEQLLAKMG